MSWYTVRHSLFITLCSLLNMWLVNPTTVRLKPGSSVSEALIHCLTTAIGTFSCYKVIEYKGMTWLD